MHEPQAQAGEPFFAALRRRDPDARVVLLPPEAPPVDRPAAPTLDLEQAREVVRHGRAVLDEILVRLVATDRWPLEEPPSRWAEHWASGTDGAVHTVAVGLDLPDDEAATATLEDVGDLLLARGFDARPVAGRRVRLLGGDGFCLVEAEVRGNRLTVSVASLPATLTDDDLRRLRTEAGS